MKKIYLNPTLEIIEVAVEAGIAQSGGGDAGGLEPNPLAIFQDEE